MTTHRCRRRTSDRYIRERLAMIEGLSWWDTITVIVQYQRKEQQAYIDVSNCLRTRHRECP
jgi:hypothetical protein